MKQLTKSFIQTLNSFTKPPLFPQINSPKISTKIASEQETIAAMKAHYQKKNIQLLSFYSSELDLIISDPAFMTLPLDDRLVNRAHGIFESLAIKKFRFFSLQQHLERLIASSKKINVNLPLPPEKIQQILLDMAVFSYQKLKNQGKTYEELEKLPLNMRIWLSSGREDFGIYSVGKQSIFYCCVFVNHNLNKNLSNLSEGVQEFTVDMNTIQSLETAKSTSYLKNCVVADISKQQGGYQGLILDAQGHVLEQAMANVAYINKNTREFVRVPPDHIIAGTTLKKSVENYIEPVLIAEKNTISKVVFRYFNVEEILNEASEFLSFGGDKVLPILSVNGQKVGSGEKGPVCQELQDWYKSLTVQEGDFEIPGLEFLKDQQQQEENSTQQQQSQSQSQQQDKIITQKL